MLIVCWSAKGGSGTTVVSAGLALGVIGARGGADAAIVDLAGDLPAVLGVAEPAGPGTLDWLASVDADAAALRRLAVPVAPDLTLFAQGSARGTGPGAGVGAPGWQRLADAVPTLASVVVIDAGAHEPAEPLVRRADRVLLVTRPCFLSLRRAMRATCRPTGVVLVDEPGRALRGADVERAVGAPIEARVPSDPAIARAVDAGLLAGRAPRSLVQPLRGAR